MIGSDNLFYTKKEKNCLFVFSVDFSHYLNPDEATKHDDETLKAVTGNDLEGISKMGNNNMDSPYCVSTFLRLNDISGGQIKLLDHSNSFEILEVINTLDQDVVNEKEIFWIKEKNSYVRNGKGYNLTYGGEGYVRSRKISIEDAKDIIN